MILTSANCSLKQKRRLECWNKFVIRVWRWLAATAYGIPPPGLGLVAGLIIGATGALGLVAGSIWMVSLPWPMDRLDGWMDGPLKQICNSQPNAF